jgi:quinol monooxygenase YgiN
MSDTSLFTMALYRPHPGKESELAEIVKGHVPALREEGLITDFTPVTLQSADGTLIEIFEWLSVEAKDQAHTSPKIWPIWENMMKVAELVGLASLPEADKPFPNFKRITL